MSLNELVLERGLRLKIWHSLIYAFKEALSSVELFAIDTCP